MSLIRLQSRKFQKNNGMFQKHCFSTDVSKIYVSTKNKQKQPKSSKIRQNQTKSNAEYSQKALFFFEVQLLK